MAVLVALVAGAATLSFVSAPAEAGIVPTVGLATAANYSVLAASTVTNTNATTIGQSVGLSPGTAVVGFPPAVVQAPGIIDVASPSAVQAQNDLTTAYNDAATRPVEFTQTNPDLVGQTLIPGVYAATAKAPLGLSGQLVLDGQNNPDAVFIFQTDSTLITSSSSTVELINGASECNVFWQVGSSATLGTGSVFVGNILALTSITVRSAVVVHGRALAQTGAVTLDNDTFVQPSCIPTTVTSPPITVPPATTTSPTAVPTTTPAGGGVTPSSSTDTTVAAGADTTAPGADTTAPGTPSTAPGTPTTAPGTPTTFDFTDITLPSTGKSAMNATSGVAGLSLMAGIAAVMLVRRRRPV